jgi:uncharacterized repeat protein (TIGR03943 family)
MQQLFNRWLPAATLATWSAVLFYYHYDDRMKNMLAEQFQTYAFISAIVLAVMSLLFVLFKADASCCSTAECGHGLSRLAGGRLVTFLILLAPIVVCARYTPTSGFSDTFKKNRGFVTSAESLPDRPKLALRPPELPLPGQGDTEGTSERPPGTEPGKLQEQPTDFLARTPEGYIIAEVLDLLYAAQDQTLREDFEGKKVELIGQYMPDPKSTETIRFKAVRMFMNCCAADAQPVATLVEVEKLPDVKEMEWVKVIGVPTFPIERGRRISVLRGLTVEKTTPPDEQFIK